MDSHPTRGSPLGCFTGVLALIPLGFAIIAGYGLWRWSAAAPEDRPEDSLGLLVGSLVGGTSLFLLLGWLTLRILKATRWKNYDPANDTSLHF